VFLLVMRQGALLALIGAIVGVGLAYLSGQVISSRVYAIRASDPLILASATFVITAITILATTIPAARAARVNPANALQSG
jgi:ABC-type antimicrobial peptide transport system permease subunit